MNLDHKTTVSAGLVITLVGAVVSFMTMNATVNSNQEVVLSKLEDMDSRLVRIERKIDGGNSLSLVESAETTKR